MDRQTEGKRAGKPEWAAMAILALPCLLYSMDLTVLNLAVPELSTALRPSETQLLWIVDIYGFVLAASLIPMGVFGDRIGRRRLLLLGAFAFGAASLAAAFSQNATMMIMSRACMGLAAATLAPSTLSMISTLFPHSQDRRMAIGIWIASFSSGGAVGPLVGGVLLEYFWWGSVFLINLPIMATLLMFGPLLLPEARDPTAQQPDLLSAFSLLLAVLALVYAIKQIAAYGWDPHAAVALAAFVAAAIHFFRRQMRLATPFLDLEMFHSVRFSAALGINVLGFFIAFGSFLLIALYLQMGLGLSQLHSGFAAAPSGLAFIIGAVSAPILVSRMGAAGLMATGFALAALGFGITGLAAAKGDLATLILGYCTFSLGLAPVFTLTTDVIVGSVPQEKAGAAAGLSEASTELGGALGIAVLGSLMTFFYRLIVEDMPHIADLPMSVATGPVAANADAAAASAAMGQALQASAYLCSVVAIVGAGLTLLIRSRDQLPQLTGETR
jgi:DHA2 family multidrug resistance protein-like MFS transporter